MVSIDDVRSRATKLGRTDVTPEIDLSEEPRSPASPEVQPGTMLVPIEAWDKMLLQLGNLHQAGQQLAEARERAAKAETEAKFLKERLSDMRAEIADLKEAGTPRQTPHPPPDPAPTRMTRIPIESDDDDVEPIELNEIPTAETEPTVSADDAMTLRAYSFEMAKHLYSTWRQRPKR